MSSRSRSHSLRRARCRCSREGGGDRSSGLDDPDDPDDPMTQAQPIRRSSRDPEVLRSVLQSWLASRLGVAAEVSDVAGTDANGMSSDTVLFRASWQDADGAMHDDALVARVAPHPADVP